MLGALFSYHMWATPPLPVLITKLRSANTVETQQYRKATKALLVLIPLLGITYILMIQGPMEGESANIFSYVRAVMISTQGFTVALFYCFLNTEVQNTVRHHLDRWKTERSIGGSRRYNYSSKDWSPRSRTESIRIRSLGDSRRYTYSKEQGLEYSVQDREHTIHQDLARALELDWKPSDTSRAKQGSNISVSLLILQELTRALELDWKPADTSRANQGS
uniref:G-protein coupled receptors family 2 profile 2 domain-containing protein n=1 Tax=Timema shepardi TaxID=629360 RepID=A0A7R9B4F9_TIMSH|nr:unnamed protein product [Timema shepardi]